MKRQPSVDVMRGFVMLLMALDHVRDYTIGGRATFTNYVEAGPALFFTRWVTHFCAPTFVFLAGTGAYLSLARGKTKSEVSRFLWTRGLVLVVLELTLVRFGWTFNFDYHVVWVQVIWALGVSMIVLSLLVHLPELAIALFGLTMIFVHNAFDGVRVVHQGKNLLGASARDWLVAVLHQQRPPVIYPLVPWIGVMAVGYVFGRSYTLPAAKRHRLFYATAATCCALFVVLRLAGVYGEPRPFEAAALHPVLAFVDVSKYPPSLLYLLMTLGPMIAGLALLEHAQGGWARMLETIGRVPMFYYLAHIYLAHAIAVVGGVLQGFSFAEMCVPFFMLPKAYGYSLGVVYVVWIGVVAALYKPCQWFASLKASSGAAWLRYV